MDLDNNWVSYDATSNDLSKRCRIPLSDGSVVNMDAYDVFSMVIEKSKPDTLQFWYLDVPHPPRVIKGTPGQIRADFHALHQAMFTCLQK